MERVIAYHCAPALAGIKPANLVACQKSKIEKIHENLQRLNLQMNCRDIYFEVLCECERRVLVLVYRKNVLEKTLADNEKKLFLNACGYPIEMSVETYINHLKSRMKNNEFPHEIGIFLGYPLHDIQGFLYHKNFGCLLCGEWKVYKDAENAKRLFKHFRNCRKALLKKVVSGKSLAQIFCAAQPG